MNPTTRATYTAVAASVVAVASLLGTRYLAGGVLLIILTLAMGWPVLTRVSRRWVSTGIISLGGTAALIAVLFGRNEPYLRYMVVAVAALVLAALVSEVFFPSHAGRAVTSVSATAAGGAVAASGAAWIASTRTTGADDLVIAGAVSLAVAALASVLTRNATLNTLAALILGVAAGFGTGYAFTAISWYGGILVGLASGVSVVLLNELYRREPHSRDHWAGVASGVTPVLVAGVLVYLGGRLLVG